MFVETLSHAGGASTGGASESHVLMLLRLAVNRGHFMEATPEGGAAISWSCPDISTGGRSSRSVTLTPELPVGTLDDSTRVLLSLIDAGAARYVTTADRRYIAAAGGTEIPQATTARLRARRMVDVDKAGRVRLTLAARLGLLAHDHVQSGGGIDGLAMCSCGFTVGAPAGEVADAVLSGHRRSVTARFVDSITATYAANLSQAS